MNILIIIIGFFVTTSLYADETLKRFIVDAHFDKEAVGVIAFDREKNQNDYYLINKKDYLVFKKSKLEYEKQFNVSVSPLISLSLDISEPSKSFTTTKGELSYEQIGCTGYTKGDLQPDGSCRGLEFKFQGKKYLMKHHMLVPYESFFDPYLLDDGKILFKRYMVGGVDESEKKYPPSIHGFLLVDFKKEQINEKTMYGISDFGAVWTSLIKSDPQTDLIWIGNNYGVFILDKDMSEKKSCFFIPESKKKDFGEFKCFDFVGSSLNKGSQLLVTLEKFDKKSVKNKK